MINVEGANEYFKSRTVYDQWNQYSREQQAGAIEQAKRDLARELGRVMREDEPPFQMGDRKRDEFAVYEQAFYTLVIDSFPASVGGSEIAPLPNDDESFQFQNTAGKRIEGYGKWSKEALLWLANRITVETITS